MSTEPASPPQIKTTWLIGTLAAFAIFAVIAAYSGHMTRAYPSYDQQRATDRYVTLDKLRAEAKAVLTPLDAQGHPTAEWIDQSKGVVRIPIDEAMAKEIETLKAQPAEVGCVIPALPPPAPANSAASTNAAPAAPAPPAKPNP